MGSKLDLRSVSWKRHVDVIPYRLSTDTDTSTDETPRPSRAQTPSLKGEDHLPGVLDSQTRQTDRQKDSMPATVHGSHQPPKQLQCPLIISSLASQNMHDRGSFKMSLSLQIANHQHAPFLTSAICPETATWFYSYPYPCCTSRPSTPQRVPGINCPASS